MNTAIHPRKALVSRSYSPNGTSHSRHHLPRPCRGDEKQLCVTLLLSDDYKLPISQLLSFDIHTKCRGCRGGLLDVATFGRLDLPPSSIHPLCFQIVADSFALFCSHKKLNPFVFKRFHTLCAKHPGVGWGTSARHSRKNVCRECDLRIPDASAGRPSGPDPRFRPCWKGSRSPSDAPAVRAEASRGLTASMSSLDLAPQASGIPVHPLFRKVAVDSR